MEFIDDKIWKPIHTLPGFECCIEYYVNKDGDIKSTKGRQERTLKQRINKNGFAQVNLTQRIGRKKTITVNVHTLVALAFLPTPPTPYGKYKNCTRITHIDNNKANNNLANLIWVKIDKDSPEPSTNG